MVRRKQFQVWQRCHPVVSEYLLTWLTMALRTASSGEGEAGGGGDLASCFMTVSGKRSSHKCLSALSSGPHTFVGCWWNQRVTQWICNNSFSVWVINSHYMGTAKHSCGCCLHFEVWFVKQSGTLSLGSNTWACNLHKDWVSHKFILATIQNSNGLLYLLKQQHFSRPCSQDN